MLIPLGLQMDSLVDGTCIPRQRYLTTTELKAYLYSAASMLELQDWLHLNRQSMGWWGYKIILSPKVLLPNAQTEGQGKLRT
jgi:hypothetical protein